MLFELKIGRIKSSVGATEEARGAKTGGLLVAQDVARFQQAVESGNVFSVANQAGVTSQAGLSATTPVLTLYNPLGSGKNTIIWYAGCIFTVAFAAAAAVFVAVGSTVQSAAVTGTLTTAHRNMKVGATQNPACRTFLAATLPEAPVAVGLLGVGLTGAITTIPALQPLGRWYDGGLVLQPGTNLSLQTSTACGASAMFCEYIWEEVDE